MPPKSNHRTHTTHEEFQKLLHTLHEDIEDLDLSHYRIDTSQAKILGEKLATLINLKKLNLSNMGFNNKGVPLIAKAIPPNIEILILNGMFKEDGAIQNLVAKLKVCAKLQEVYLLDNPISPRNMNLIHTMLLDNEKIKVLHISLTDITQIKTTSPLIKIRLQSAELVIKSYIPDSTVLTHTLPIQEYTKPDELVPLAGTIHTED
jgi:hypothetical protein